MYLPVCENTGVAYKTLYVAVLTGDANQSIYHPGYKRYIFIDYAYETINLINYIYNLNVISLLGCLQADYCKEKSVNSKKL